jgi:hypothetical protein
MCLFLKIKPAIIFITAMCLTSCARVIIDPAKKYNDDFLAKNNLKISRLRRKHKAIAKNYGILYDKEKERITIDDDFYKTKTSAKKRRYFVLEGKENIDKFLEENIKYLGDDISVYYRESKLKGGGDSTNKNKDFEILYLTDNYSSYKEDRQTQKSVELDSEKLYGSWKERKEKAYNQIESEEILVSFDYIDLLSRVRTEVYLEEKDNAGGSGSGIANTVTLIKDKILGIFKGGK